MDNLARLFPSLVERERPGVSRPHDAEKKRRLGMKRWWSRIAPVPAVRHHKAVLGLVIVRFFEQVVAKQGSAAIPEETWSGNPVVTKRTCFATPA